MSRDRGVAWGFGRLIGLIVCLLTAGAGAGAAQQRQQIVEDAGWFVRVGFAPDYVLPTSDFLSGVNAAGRPIRWSPDTTIEIGRQTDGSRLWHQLYKLPAYGLGFSAASFGNARELGQPLEAYAFVSWPLFRLLDNVEVTTDFSTGLSWHWQTYDEDTNPYNTVIASNVNVRFDWGFYARYVINPRLSVYAGLDFTHRSNGEVLQPNDGINAIGPRVALRYNLDDQRRAPVLVMLPPFPRFRPAWEFVVGANAGQKSVLGQLHPLIRTTFHTADVSAAVQRHFYRYGKAGAGADVTYDGAAGARVDPSTGTLVAAGPGERWALGVYGSYEHIIARFSLIAQLGYTIARRFDQPGSLPLFERYAWQYHFTDRLSGIVGMRLIDVFNATQVEIGAVYRIH